MEKQIEGKIRIKDIALLAGVSEGTVDRVIHNRGKVSTGSMEVVNQVMEKLNYTPNLLARSLATRKRTRLVCIIPKYYSGDYWDAVNSSFDLAAKDFEDYNVTLEKIYFNQLNASSFTKNVESVFLKLPDGVILSPFFREETQLFISRLAEQNIPFSFFDSMIENTDFLTYYGQDSFQSGYVAAKLLCSNLPDNSEILIVRTKRRKGFSNQTSNRQKGFHQYIETQAVKKHIRLIEILLSDAAEKSNLSLLRKTFRQNKSIKAAITFNSKVYRLANYLELLKQTEISVTGYDLLKENVICLKRGSVSYLIAQRPEKQVYCSVRDMCRKILFGKSVTKINYVPIDILMEENIDHYMNFKE
jgi:LacI family transcriptional regulator